MWLFVSWIYWLLEWKCKLRVLTFYREIISAYEDLSDDEIFSFVQVSGSSPPADLFSSMAMKGCHQIPNRTLQVLISSLP